MTAREIARALGGGESWRGGGNFSALCPCHRDRKPSLSLRDGDGGKLLLKCHAGCDPRAILAELRRRDLLNGTSCPTDPRPQRSTSEYALELRHAAQPIAGTLAERYLRETRGISIALPPTLLFHHRVKLPKEQRYLPAMIALVSGEDRRTLAVQVTWIDPTTAQKGTTPEVPKGRRTYGALLAAAVRLGPAAGTLGLAEGVETALAVTEITGIVCWATLGVERFSKVEIPRAVENVTVFADNGDNVVWLKTEMAACRLARHHIVRLRRPTEHKDFNDALLAKRRAD